MPAVCSPTCPLFPSPVCFNLSSNTEDDAALQTNKQIYSQLLRATANRNSTLLERIEVVICLLEQLASGSSGSSGTAVPWPEVVSEDCLVSAFPSWSCSVHSVLRLIKYKEMPFNQVHSGYSLPVAGRGCGVVWFLPVKVRNRNGTKSFLNVFPWEVLGSLVITDLLWCA